MGGAVRGREGRPKEADFEGEIRSVVEETLPMVVECSEAPLEKTRERGLIKVPNVRNIHNSHAHLYSIPWTADG